MKQTLYVTFQCYYSLTQTAFLSKYHWCVVTTYCGHRKCSSLVVFPFLFPLFCSCLGYLFPLAFLLLPFALVKCDQLILVLQNTILNFADFIPLYVKFSSLRILWLFPSSIHSSSPSSNITASLILFFFGLIKVNLICSQIILYCYCCCFFPLPHSPWNIPLCNVIVV